jgi:hypothetical protein
LTLHRQVRLAEEVTEHINWAHVFPVTHDKLKIIMTNVDVFRCEAPCRNAPTFRTIPLPPSSVEGRRRRRDDDDDNDDDDDDDDDDGGSSIS